MQEEFNLWAMTHRLIHWLRNLICSENVSEHIYILLYWHRLREWGCLLLCKTLWLSHSNRYTSNWWFLCNILLLYFGRWFSLLHLQLSLCFHLTILQMQWNLFMLFCCMAEQYEMYAKQQTSSEEKHLTVLQVKIAVDDFASSTCF